MWISAQHVQHDIWDFAVRLHFLSRFICFAWSCRVTVGLWSAHGSFVTQVTYALHVELARLCDIIRSEASRTTCHCPCRPVNNIFVSHTVQLWLYSISKNTQSNVLHTVLWAQRRCGVCVCVCAYTVFVCTRPKCCNLQEVLLSYSQDGWHFKLY